MACELGGRFSEECLDLIHRLVTLKAQRSGEADGRLIKLLYSRRWWCILSLAAQRAVASNLLGGDWAPLFCVVAPSDEELLSSAVFPPAESRMR